MRAPYDLKSQYWPLAEQETLYRNSKSLSQFFLLLLTLAWTLLCFLCSDQLVITQFPHNLDCNWGAAPSPIPVQYSLNDVFSRYQVSLVFLSFPHRSNTGPRRLPRSKNAGGEGMQASSISRLTKYRISTPTTWNTNF